MKVFHRRLQVKITLTEKRNSLLLVPSRYLPQAEIVRRPHVAAVTPLIHLFHCHATHSVTAAPPQSTNETEAPLRCSSVVGSWEKGDSKMVPWAECAGAPEWFSGTLLPSLEQERPMCARLSCLWSQWEKRERDSGDTGMRSYL